MTITNLTTAYQHTTILEEINFELKEHLTILGSNGSGKSTLAKALCGLLPYEGSIQIQDKELRNFSPKHRAQSISYIPSKMQSFEQFTTVEDFVLLGRYPYKESFKDYNTEDRTIAGKVLKELNITKLKSHTLNELSSGEQQLTLIAQALAQESQILIFDEPTSNLDPKNTSIFVQELKKLRQDHQVILITHDIQLASFFDDPVLFIQDKKAQFFEKGFFETEILTQAYGINFKNENGMIGIAYA